MKTFFSLVNFVVGILSLLIGVGNFLFLISSNFHRRECSYRCRYSL